MKLNELKPGDWVVVTDNGVSREGAVVRVSNEEREVCVDNGIQEFWYPLDQVQGIPVDEAQLMRLGFEKMDHGAENGVKYGKGPFRVLVPAADNFSSSEVWYREDRRLFDRPITVSELQNIHLQMTKVPLLH
ncbi:hypothetical protein [Niabella drilacis]|uniref:Uncharacterized protein n=1 Tax=Niabella drilacis (strain DSM 25811 / CCM 8410 / CCUG 62505 / LMG 26954 / E90) TaxID=1285928 RepID=A0A1G6NUS6_NIADE|nr:hypothetical protein [Niabella drilacis]SDC71006.1 hypothetical protein SAMN04487894_103386 [Niabella drilacis]